MGKSVSCMCACSVISTVLRWQDDCSHALLKVDKAHNVSEAGDRQELQVHAVHGSELELA